MTRIKLAFVHEYMDRHGKIRRYVRRPGMRKVALPDPSDKSRFAAIYAAAMGDAASVDQDQLGYIYFIAMGSEYVKIGFSKNCRKRKFDLQVASPLPLETIFIQQARRSDEVRLHKRFSKLKSHGEWFKATPELMAFISGLKLGERSVAGDSWDDR